MQKQTFLVSLNAANIPPEFFEMFKEYLGQWREVHHFLSGSIGYANSFVELLALPNGPNQKPMRVYLHPHYILAIADFDEGNPPMGFLHNSQLLASPDAPAIDICANR